MEEDIKILEDFIYELKSFGLTKDTLEISNAIENLIKAYKKLEEKNKIIKGNYYTLSKDIQMVTTELGFPEDTIIAMIKEKYIEKSLVEEKIEELDKKINDIPDNEGNFSKAILIRTKITLKELLEKRKEVIKIK